ncbi:MAG: DUF1446 domain-containing protein [Chitinophagaceae bacterium]|nr:DUF1446 domain-containing protein [Chitinophagaceae bacterium]
MKNSVRIGCGAGFSGDRLEPAIVLVEKGRLDYLVLECLAERTIALAQKRKANDPTKGYDPLLERRVEKLLPLLKQNSVKLITNMGAANPMSAAEKIIGLANKMQIDLTVAAVLGDDVFHLITGNEISTETNSRLADSGELISANAYLGADAILPALEAGADIIITGRVADPSLFVAPLVHEFGWDMNNANIIAKATIVGHLMECAGQITGGYFADPVDKPVRDMENLGHPVAEVFSDGTSLITKVEGTGGVINLATVKEQLLYEVTNPKEYITPDVVTDFTTVFLKANGKDCVHVSGGNGVKQPGTLKVSVGYKAGFMGEGEISYAGHHAYERAQLAGKTISRRIKNLFTGFRIDFIGGNNTGEVRLRVAGRTPLQKTAEQIGEEVEALYTNGPAGGGGVRKYVTEVIGIVSTLIDRNLVKSSIELEKT